MKNRLFWSMIAALMLVTGISAGASAEGTPDRVGFTAADKAFHLTDELFFYYRPGLVVDIVDYSIPADLQPEVTFTMKDPGGLPLDLDGIFTPGDVSSRFFLVYIPQGEEQIVNYITGSRGPTSDRNGTYTQLEPGKYLYKFENAIPADYDADATHTLAIASRRDLRDFDLDRYSSNDVVNFVPSGASVPMPRSVVTTE
ncbi:MAG: hypothetical protein KJO92_09135, partial [Gammaproteobacteria bacterium]|nr:hypothetical protein [Gammaproteobacteria bacterium]